MFLVKVRSYNSFLAFTSLRASFAEYARIDKQMANTRDGVYTFRVQWRISHGVGTLLPAEVKRPMSAHLYIYDSDMEAHIYMRAAVL
jgi:hypothetical protein